MRLKLETGEAQGPQKVLALWWVSRNDGRSEGRTHGIGSYAMPVLGTTQGMIARDHLQIP